MDIYSYSDPGDYLKDAYLSLKSECPGVSHRYIAKALKFRSSAVFRLMISGRITPSPETVDGLAKIFSLSTQEKDYLSILFHLRKIPDSAMRTRLLNTAKPSPSDL